MKFYISFSFVLLSLTSVWAKDSKIEFFEKNIRPILAQECYDCHSSRTKSKGGLELDSRLGWQKGSHSGQVILPGNPKESLLLKAIRHEHEELKMPEGGGRLDQSIIDHFETWIANGAFDPREKPSTLAETKADQNWDAIAKRRADWWSFQPLKKPEVPQVDVEFSQNEIDQYLRKAQVEQNLQPVEEANPETILRRLRYVLVGLPASISELDNFLHDWQAQGPQKTIENKVDELLASEGFGERWAAHWMDWFRYSEGHGGQGDPIINHAHEYRNYLIRALNENVPYDKMIKEHIAGDLLPEPRKTVDGQFNESVIGTAQYRFVEHGFFPVDALDELIKFTDNQIDVITKATMGLTVSCARCHDHKFDAISQKDYFRLFGVFASSRPAQRSLVTESILEEKKEGLGVLRDQLQQQLKSEWLEQFSSGDFANRIAAWKENREVQIQSRLNKIKHQEEKKVSAKKRLKPIPNLTKTDFMYALYNFEKDEQVQKEWDPYHKKLQELMLQAQKHNQSLTLNKIDFRNGLPDSWRNEEGKVQAVLSGELGYITGKEMEFLSILPKGILSYDQSILENTSIFSEDITVQKGSLAVQWAGAGGALFRLVPENYPRHGGLLYKQYQFRDDGRSIWTSQKTDFWESNRGYYQLTTRNLSTANVESKLEPSQGSWFLLQELRTLNSSTEQIKPEFFPASLLHQVSPELSKRSDLIQSYVELARASLQKWNTENFKDHDAMVLTEFLKETLLKNKESEFSSSIQKLCQKIRTKESEIYQLTRRHAPGVVESDGFDQPVYPRGNHKKTGEVIPRGFIAALGGKNFEINKGSGRLQLAKAMMNEPHPIFARIFVNRLWHYVFGQGLVKSMDNFGRTGSLPTHPELLDHLANQTIQEGWDIKKMIRHMVTTKSFRLKSVSPDQHLDPGNRYLSYANLRRFDAEVIQDHLLAVSGQLDSKKFGHSVGYQGKPTQNLRRAVYIQRKRKGQNDLMASFDVPVPTSTKGKRESSNTPSQSMALLNSPYVAFLAEQWASNNKMASSPERLQVCLNQLITQAYTRKPFPDEIRQLEDFYHSLELESKTKSLAQVAHLVFNCKEFIYLE